MMKYFLVMMFLMSCGGDSGSSDSSSSVDNVSTNSVYDHEGILQIAESSNNCFGGSLYYIEHEGKIYQVSDYSVENFNTLIEDIFDKKISYKPFEAGGCHNKYNFKFSGKFTREMKWGATGEIMTDVIQVETYLIE